jgi:hypothetical protein
VGYGKLSLESDERNEEICMYLVWDYNEKWLKDSRLLGYIVVVLIVKVRVEYVMQVGCFLELIFLHLSKIENNGLTWVVSGALNYWLP